MKQITVTLRLGRLPRLIRTCSRCRSSFYEISGRFRVNANGKLLDIWLVCRCVCCKSTWNLSVHDRIDRTALNPEDYQGYLANDRALVLRHVFDPAFLHRNRTLLDLDGTDICVSGDVPPDTEAAQVIVRLAQPLPLSFGRAIALALGVSLSRVRRMQKDGMLLFSDELKKTAAAETFSFVLLQGWQRGKA